MSAAPELVSRGRDLHIAVKLDPLRVCVVAHVEGAVDGRREVDHALTRVGK